MIRLSAIGDVLLATPLLRMLKTRYPHTNIDFLIKKSYVSLIETNRNVNHVHAFSPDTGLTGLEETARGIRSRHYDVVIDLQGNFRSRFLALCSGAKIRSRAKLDRFKRFLLVQWKWDTYREMVPVPLRFLKASPFSVKDDGFGLDLDVPSDASDKIGVRLRKLGHRRGERLIALAPGAGRNTKKWPAARFAEVGRDLSERGYRIVLVGGEKDAETCAQIAKEIGRTALDFSGRLSLVETAALIRRSELIVTHDTGVMHMASALGTKIAALFGPTTRHFGFMPFRADAVVIEKKLDCRPCSYHGTECCPKKHFRCMLGISAGEVVKRSLNLLNSR